ncbi:S24 family peptidase, partial [Sutterella wadsworthensis]
VHISDGGIYVLTIDGEYRIKYLSKFKNGLLVSSENSAYRPEEYVGDECDRLKILGRVLEVNRSL